MLNVLVKGKVNGFVLFRALEPTKGIALMKRRRGLDDVRKLCSGPGKLTQAMNITRRHHEMDLCRDRAHCFVLPSAKAEAEAVADRRIGITKSAHLPWRFTLRDSPFVSVRAKDGGTAVIDRRYSSRDVPS
jgi:DNA-3-methyladenine glycosylase